MCSRGSGRRGGGCCPPRCCRLFLVLAGAFAPLLILAAWWIDTSILRLDDLPKVNQVWTTLPRVSTNCQWDGKRPLQVVFLTWGTRGDHQPSVALGLELGRRGHTVTVLGLAAHQNLIEQYAPYIRYVELYDDHLPHLIDTFAEARGADILSFAKSYSTNSSRPLVSQYLQHAANADVLIGHHPAMIQLHHLTVAQVLQKPLFFMAHDLTVPTSEYSFNMDEFRVKDYGRRKNVANYRIFSVLFGTILTTWGTRSPWRQYRTELGLSTPFPFYEFLHPSHLADFPVFHTADATLWPRPHDFAPHWYSTGFWLTDGVGINANVNATATNAALWKTWRQSRIHLGRPLVYVGQGSFRHHDQTLFAELLQDACDTLNLDAVVLDLDTANDEGGNFDVAAAATKNVLSVSEVQHDSLFPECAVIVHHGGAGTASQVIRSGHPGVCVPSITFQEIWGGRLEEYGAGILLRPVDARNAWRENRTNLLAQSIKRALHADMQKRATELGELAQQHSDAAGVKLAADKVEFHLRALVRAKSDADATASPTRANHQTDAVGGEKFREAEL